MEISRTDHVRSEEVLLRVTDQRNILHEISKWKANLIGHILRRNCLLQQVIEEKIKGGDRIDRKTMKKTWEATGCPYLIEEDLDRTMWRAHFGRGFGRVVRHTTMCK